MTHLSSTSTHQKLSQSVISYCIGRWLPSHLFTKENVSRMRMDKKGDFIERLGPDLSIKICSYLNDPCDLVRVSSISRSWHQFVIENGLCKQLCLKLFPEVSAAARVIEVDNLIEPVTQRFCNSMNWECLKRNHRVYAFLARGLAPFMTKDCISQAIMASSTDHYPEESVQHTLEPRDRTENGASYWSSSGEIDPSVPETLIYNLNSKICIVTEIHIQPFQAYFQYGFPIYSVKAVQFRLGCPKYSVEREDAIADDNTASHKFDSNRFIWTYTSPEFKMAQENRSQRFRLPEPVLCVGGVLQVELLGRVQKQETDGLFYVCVSHVQVVGRPLMPGFDVQIQLPSGKCTLKYNAEPYSSMSRPSLSLGGVTSTPLHLHTSALSRMRRGFRQWEQRIFDTLLGNRDVIADDQSDEELPH